MKNLTYIFFIEPVLFYCYRFYELFIVYSISLTFNLRY